MRGALSCAFCKASPSVSVYGDLMEKAHVQDAFYISLRYPNAYAEGAPFEYFGRLQSHKAIHYTREDLEFVPARMA
ncbi:MAG: hypothetical protein ACK4K2_02375 [Dehalococcoidia bacterium]